MLNYELVDDVAAITMDDGKANAVSHGFIDNLTEGLDRAETEAKALVIFGRSGVFSAGFDLKEIGKGQAESKALVDRGAALLFRLFTYPLPVVAASAGHAIAAGALLMLASDTRIGVAGDAGVRAYAQTDAIFVGMILILIFAECIGLYGMIIAIILVSS